MMALIRNYKIRESYREESPRRVDREAGIIHDVKVLGKISKNGREYLSEAIQKASHLYEGAKVNIDHIDPKSRRSYLDGIGEIRNVKVSEDGLRGDLHYNKNHPAAEKLAEDAERFPRSFGLSHDADGQARKNGKKTIVESIDHVNSVDIVGSPATNSSLYESEEIPMKVTIRSLVESFTDATKKAILVKRLKEMDGEMPAMMDAQVDAPDAADVASGGAEDQIDAAFKAMVMGVLDDDSLDVAGKVAKIKLILQSQDKLMNGTAPASADKPADAPGDKPAEGGTQEDFKKLAGSLQESIEVLNAQNCLLISGVAVTDERVKAFREAKDPAARQALIEGWHPGGKPAGHRPSFTGRKFAEGTEEDAKAGAADARRAFGIRV